MNGVDENEMRLLAALRKNARASLLGLSKELGMPSSTLHDKVHRYEGSTIIKHTTLLDFSKLGYSRSYFAIRTLPSGRQRVQAFLEGCGWVNNLHKIDSGFDFLAEIISDQKGIEDLDTALRSMSEVIDLKRFSILEDVKREEFKLGVRR